MSLSNLNELYEETRAALAVHDFARFRELQLVISDAMQDIGDESYWILQLDWQCYRVGDKRRENLKRVYSSLQPNLKHDSLVFDVPIPIDAYGYAKNPTHDKPFVPLTKRFLSGVSFKLATNQTAIQNMNRTRFAGFPPYALRFLGLSPNRSIDGSSMWRFSWVNSRIESNIRRKAKAVNERRHHKHVEDIADGGYMRLFFKPDTCFRWRESLQNFEDYHPMDEAKQSVEQERTIFDEVTA